MRNKFLIVFLLVVLPALLFFGCAKPNYQNPQPQALQNTKPDDDAPTATCELFFEVERLCVKLEWKAAPNATDEAGFTLRFYTLETPAVLTEPRLTPAARLWMPDMGHGSRPVEINKLATGEYSATKVFFIMPGLWEVYIQLKNGADVVDQVYVKLTL